MKKLLSLLVSIGLIIEVAFFAEDVTATKTNEIASVAENKPPQLIPGGRFTIEFPDMPPTMHSMFYKTDIKPCMTVVLPKNYSSSQKYPLLIFLPGECGSNGKNPVQALLLSEQKDFVCLDLPYFKSSPSSDLRITEEDITNMWALYKTMLTRMEQIIPNLDSKHYILGGFSNGAYVTAGLIDNTNGEAVQKFSAFFFIEAGRMTHYELLKGKPVLLLYGALDPNAKIRGEGRAAPFKDAGAILTTRPMEGVGHAFPESERPFVREWLHNVAFGNSSAPTPSP